MMYGDPIAACDFPIGQGLSRVVKTLRAFR
jgi:hypothetical protein